MKTCVIVLVCALAVLTTARLSSLRDLVQPPKITIQGLEQLGADFNIEVMIDNFIKGSQIGELVPHSAACGKAQLAFANNISAAVNEWMKVKSLNNFYGIMESLGLMTPVVEHCYETWVDAAKHTEAYFAKFKTFTNYIDSFRKNLQTNVFKISAEATQLRNDIVNMDFNEAALDLGELLYELLNFEPISSALSYTPNPYHSFGYINYDNGVPSDFQDFFDGYLNGTVVFNTTHNLACANSSRWWIESIDEAIVLFNKKGQENQRQAWMLIAKSFSMLYPLSYNCITGVEEQIAAFFQHADWEQPWNIADRVGRNLPAIRAAVMSMEGDIQKGNYYGAGNDLGSLVYFLLFEGQEQ